jgi:hypothetical protein
MENNQSRREFMKNLGNLVLATSLVGSLTSCPKKTKLPQGIEEIIPLQIDVFDPKDKYYPGFTAFEYRIGDEWYGVFPEDELYEVIENERMRRVRTGKY